jgi:hypothetical protein
VASVGLAAEVLVQHLLEHALLGCCPGEQRHRRPELLGVDRPEDSDSVCPGQMGQDACTLHEPGPRMGCARKARASGVPEMAKRCASRTPAQAGDLRENEPHPVAQLSAVPELTHRTGVGPAGVLGRSYVSYDA